MVARKNSIGLVLAGLLLSILMASMDNTIVATAMGDIVGEAGWARQVRLGYLRVHGG
ncbi:hypothetical protein Q0F98_12610 [Paenibacillus amylolyticus]|nr:hypothetical protein Q0F98_12610 [Paenibacillus amylolyticus]